LAEVLALGNTTGGTDLAVSAGDDITFTDSSKAIFGAGSDLQIYHDGSHSYIEDAGTGSIKIKVGDFRVENASGNNLIKGVGDVATLHHAGAEKLATASGGVTVTGTLTPSGVVTANAGVVVDNFTLEGTTLALSSGDMLVDVAGTITLDADDAGEIRLKDGGTQYGALKIDSSRFKIQSIISDADMLFAVNDGGSEVTALSFDASAAGAATFNSTVAATSLTATNGVLNLDDNGSHNGIINSPASLFVNIDSDNTNTGELFAIAKDRTSTSGGTELFRVQENGKVGIGVSDPDSTLDVSGGSNKLGILRVTQRASGAAAYGLDVGLDSSSGDPVFSAIANDSLTESFRIDRGTGGVIINESGADADFRVEGNTRSNLLVVDGGKDMVGIGTTPDQSWGSNSVGITIGIADTDAGAITWREISGADDFCFTWNSYHDNTNWKYASNNPSSKFNMTNGTHVFATAVAGSADANIAYLENLEMNTTGAVFNDGGIDLDFRVASDTSTHALFVQGSDGNVGIGTNAPVADLHISGGAPTRLLLQMDGDTAGGEAQLQFKADSQDTDARIKAAIIFRRDDPGTRGTGALHLSVNGDNNDVSATTAHSRMTIESTGSISINPQGTDADFTVASDTDANALFVDGADGTVTVSKQLTTSSGASAVMRTSQATAISGTTNTTIVTNIGAVGGSSASAAQVIVYGSDNGANAFMDTLNCMGSQAVVVAQSSTLDGSPHGRTYAIAGLNLNVQLASGASGYSVNCCVTTLQFPF